MKKGLEQLNFILIDFFKLIFFKKTFGLYFCRDEKMVN